MLIEMYYDTIINNMRVSIKIAYNNYIANKYAMCFARIRCRFDSYLLIPSDPNASPTSSLSRCCLTPLLILLGSVEHMALRLVFDHREKKALLRSFLAAVFRWCLIKRLENNFSQQRKSTFVEEDAR